MRSSSRSCARAGRYRNSPSADQAVGFPASNPACRSAAGQSSRRSMGTSIRSDVGFAPCARSVDDLNSSTLGRSNSYTRVPAGQGRRQARASRPAARITTCRSAASPAARKNSSINAVRQANKSPNASHPRGVDRGRRQRGRLAMRSCRRYSRPRGLQRREKPARKGHETGDVRCRSRQRARRPRQARWRPHFLVMFQESCSVRGHRNPSGLLGSARGSCFQSATA